MLLFSPSGAKQRRYKLLLGIVVLLGVVMVAKNARANGEEFKALFEYGERGSYFGNTREIFPFRNRPLVKHRPTVDLIVITGNQASCNSSSREARRNLYGRSFRSSICALRFTVSRSADGRRLCSHL